MGRAMRMTATAGVLAVVLGLGSCAADDGGDATGDGANQSSSTYAAQLDQALQSATSDFERAVLQRAKKDGKISEADYREANERYAQCMAGKGDDIEFDTDQSTGLMQERLNADEHYDSDKVNEDSMACAQGTNLLIRDLYERMLTNPTNADEIELIVGCLKRHDLVPETFTKQDYLTESAKSADSSALDTDSAAFAQCLADPKR